LGIAAGDRVKLTSRRGELVLKAKVDDRGKPPRGTVFVPFFDEGKLINRLTLDAMDNISYEPDYKKCAVKLEKA
jgi:nitrate reductase NapA